METRTHLLALIERFAPRLKHPYLFLALLVLFLVDLVIPDPLPFVDELVLAVLASLLGSWRTRRGTLPSEEKPPESTVD